MRYRVNLGESTIEFAEDQYHQPRAGCEALPACNMTWHGTAEYCRWLSGKTSNRYRLPTEQEWQKAARETGEHLYRRESEKPEPEHLREAANRPHPTVSFTGPYVRHFGSFTADGFDVFMPVDSLPGDASPYGCLHMADNASE